jgi:hypothetical protein
MLATFETVYSVNDYYDGPRRGVADFNGQPHLYESEWNDTENNYSEVFCLSPVDQQTLDLVREDWEIWLRWERAFHDRQTTHDTHPALPDDRRRHDEIAKLLDQRLRTSVHPVRALATFRRATHLFWDGKGHSPPLEVQWQPIKPAATGSTKA